MDVFRAINDLFEEKKRIDRMIAALEAKQKSHNGSSLRKRRGRTSMSAEERRQVSERMRKYWEDRRRAPVA
jgi:hypothetical protein